MKRLSIVCTTILVVLLLLAPATGCQQQASNELETSKLEEFMAQAIIDDCRSPEGVYVAHVVFPSTPDEPISPLRIWKYEQGQLVDGDQDALMLAITSDQPSDWPPSVFLFEFTSVQPDYAEVDVHTLYNMGIMPGSRGGNAAVWKLAKQDDQWTVVNQEVYLYWD